MCDFNSIATKARSQARLAGLKPSDLSPAIKEVRAGK
jgi:hypothetical protein